MNYRPDVERAQAEAMARAQAEMLERMNRLQEQGYADALRGTRQAQPRKPSRFASIEVVDLEPDAAGVWCVPTEMLPFVRAL